MEREVCRVVCKSEDGKMLEVVGLKKRTTIYSNFHLLVTDDENEVPVGVVEIYGDGDKVRFLGDYVEITGDAYGYIAPGITRSGKGQIVEIVNDHADDFYGVMMENGDFGYVKSSRISRLIDPISSLIAAVKKSAV